MRLSFNQQLLLFTVVTLLGIGTIVYAVYQSQQKLVESTGWVQHTQRVIYESGNILSLAKDIQAAARGYAMTQDSDFLSSLYPAEAAIFKNIHQLRLLTIHNAVQQQRIDSLQRYTQKRLEFLYRTITVRNTKGLQAAVALTATKEGENYADHIRQIIADIQQEEQVLLEQRKQANAQSIQSFNTLSVVLCVVIAILFMLFFATVNVYSRQRRKQEADLIAANIETKELYNNAPCGYFSVDANIVLSNVNQTLLDWLGYKAEEVVGKMKYEDLLTSFSRQKHLDSFKEVFAAYVTNGYVYDLEYIFQRKDGTDFPALVNSIAVLDERGNFIKSRSTVFDNTQRKKIEEQLRAVNKELESFSYSVSHDLRAPLRAINGFAKILAEDYANSLDDEAKRIMNTITFNAKKMSQLIDDLLNFSRLSRREFSKATFGTHEMVTSICNELKEQQAQRHIEFKIGALPAINADGMIKQVWENLLSNAVKYTGQRDKALIEIKAEHKPAETVFSITDNGAGFDMRYAGKLFGVFQRLHGEEEFDGTGVGLAIVQRVVTKHGGKVWAVGKLNEGASFFFSIPKN